MSDDIGEVKGWIEDHQDEMIDFLKEFLSYRSPTGDEKEVVYEFVKPFFEKEMGWDEIDVVDVAEDEERPNVNAVLRGSGDGKNLLFNGHSDVVDVSEEAEKRWTKDPWDPTIEEGKIYGRGSNDMKGPNTAMIWAAKAIMENDIELEGDLLMSIVAGEELNQQDIGSIPATKALQDKGFDIPFCVNTEPTSNEIHTKSAATFDFTINISGKEVHTSQKNLTQYPQRFGVPMGQDIGVDAVRIMKRVLDRLNDLEHQWNMRYRDKIYGGGGYPIPKDMQGVGPIGINCTLIEAGTYLASIPGNAEIQGHVFYPPDLNDEKLWKEMKEAVESLATIDDWLKENPPEMSWKDTFDWPAYEVPVDHEGCKVLGEAVNEATGKEAVYSGFKAVDDNPYIQYECGVDTISMGPGALYMGTHGPDEYVPIDQLMEAAKIYATMMIKWCG